jgi:hypothetical protein
MNFLKIQKKLDNCKLSRTTQIQLPAVEGTHGNNKQGQIDIAFDSGHW